MLANFLLVAALLATVATAAGTITITKCPTGLCGANCSVEATIPQGVCIPLGSGGQKAHCVNVPHTKCITQTQYQPGSNCGAANALSDAVRRCGVCESAPIGFGVIDCSASPIRYRFGCDSKCQTCANHTSAVVGQCGHLSLPGENITYTINAVVKCDSIIYFRNYVDNSCTTEQGNQQAAVAGNYCNGFYRDGESAGYEYQCNNGKFRVPPKAPLTEGIHKA